MLRSNRMARQGTEPIAEADERGGSSDEGEDDGLDPKRYQVHVNKPLTPAELAAQKRGSTVPNGMVTNAVQPAPTQQVQPRAAAPGTLTDAAGAGGLSNGIRARPASTAVPQQQQQAQPTETAAARKARETAEERQKRFSTLGAGSPVAQEYPSVAPAIALPSASAFTIDAHKKRTAPEATLVLPSANERTQSYRAQRADSDDEEEEQVRAEQRDEVRSLDKDRRRTSSFGGFGKKGHSRKASDDSDSVVAGRRVLQKRSSIAAYQGSDAGESTARGGSSRHEKSRSEGHKSGGLFGSIGSLFKKRDVGSIGKERDEEDSRTGGGGRWSTRTDSNIAKVGGGSAYGSGGKKKKAARQDDSDSDAPDPRSLVRVVNNGNRGVNRVSAFSDVGAPRTGTVSSRNLSSFNTDSTWVPPPERERLRAMSDVGASRASSTTVKRKSTTGAAAGGGLDRKSSIKSTATTATGTGTVKKKKKVAAAGTGTAGAAPAATLAPQPSLMAGSRQSSYDASALVSNVAAMQNKGQVGRTIAQNPAQRVTRDTPSLMSVVAPSAPQPIGMHMPSAKNPGLSRSNSMASQTYLGTLAPSSGASNVGASSTVGTADAPVKKKKTVKRSSTVGNVAGNAAPAPTLTTSATTPTLLSGGTAIRPKAPASILSDGSTIGRRKSVRLADDTRTNEARYDNAGGPAVIVPQSSAPVNGSSKSGFNEEWGTRIGRDNDVSSDEEGDEYAKIRAQLNRSERELKGAGFLDKGKGRAV